MLLSGGMDSATVLAIAKDQGFTNYTLSFDYGQRHHAELEAAASIAKAMGSAEHRVVQIDLAAICNSALTNPNETLPPHSPAQTIPPTYVPARNIIFLSFALAWAESLGASRILLGVNQVDYSGYPDCRKEFIEAFQQVVDCGMRSGVEAAGIAIEAPLLEMSKADIIRCGIKHGVDYALTVSCYGADAQGRACGLCSACVLRQEGFRSAGVADTTRYARQPP